MLTTLTILAAIQAVPQAAPVAAQPPQTVLRVHSLAPLLRSPGAPPKLLTVPVIPIGDQRSGAGLLGDYSRTSPNSSSITALLRRGPGASDLDVRLAGHTLLVSGEPDAVARVDRRLAFLQQSLLRTVKLRAALYRPSEPIVLPAGAAASRDFVQRLGAPEWTGQALVPSGHRTALQRGSRVPFVRDFEVEVAEDSSVEDPKVDGFFAGVQVAVEPHVLANGEALLLGQFLASAQRGTMQTRNPGGGADGARITLDVPTVAVTHGTFSGRLAAGDSLIYASQGRQEDGDDVVLVVTVEAIAPAPEPVDSLFVLPVAGLSSGVLRGDAEPPARYLEYENTETFGAFAPDTAVGLIDRTELEDLLRVAATGADEDTPWSIDFAGGFMVFEGSARQVAAWRSVVTELERALLVNVRPSLITEAQVDGRSVVVHRVSIPAMVGQQHSVVRGIETTVLRDYDVEIAQKAAVSNPVTDVAFRGLSAAIGVLDGIDGRQADVDVVLGGHGPIRRRPTEGEGVGDLYYADTEIARFTWLGPVPDGGAILGEGVRVDATRDGTGGEVPTIQRVEIR